MGLIKHDAQRHVAELGTPVLQAHAGLTQHFKAEDSIRNGGADSSLIAQ